MSRYKIKDLEALTGIKSHTIRIWEKRYNVLEPKRTSTKIRTYSDKDLVTLINISILNKNGWKISKIATLTELELVENVEKTLKSPATEIAVVNLLIKSLSTLDEGLFNRVIDKAVQKEGFKRTYLNYIIPFLTRIGVMWLVGSINAAQEHFISSLIRQKIIVAINNLPDSKSSSIDFVLYCKENEMHELSLLFYDFCIKEKGFQTLYLGQNLPTSSLLNVIKTVKPVKGIVTSFISAVDKQDLKGYIEALTSQINIPLFAGGGQLKEINIVDNQKLISIETLIGV